MSLHYVIDGYNLIKHRLYQPSNKIKDDRLSLLEFIKSEKLCGSSRNNITVVFDGYGGAVQLKDDDIRVIFSGELSADETIKRLIQKKGNLRNAVVISDDKDIKYFAKSLKIKAIGIEEFVRYKKKRVAVENESPKSQLSYSAMHKINQELRELWLK